MEAPLMRRGRLERYLDCKEAIQTPVVDLIDRAVALGWTHDEVATALINLAAELFPDSREEATPADFRSVVRH